jgi:hypothetical protein
MTVTITLYPLGEIIIFLLLLIMMIIPFLLGCHYGWKACEKKNKPDFEFENQPAK